MPSVLISIAIFQHSAQLEVSVLVCRVIYLMGVNLQSYRAAIGLFAASFVITTTSDIYNLFLCPITFIFSILIINLLLLISGNVHPNPGPKQHGLILAHLNARSLCIPDKFSEISALVSLHKFDVFGVSETWLNANISNDQLVISGYNSPLRNDRVGYRGGGVAMYIANHLPYARKCEYEHAGIELLWVEIMLNKSKVLCGVCYRPPNSNVSQTDEFFRLLQCSMDQIGSNNYTGIYIINIGSKGILLLTLFAMLKKIIIKKLILSCLIHQLQLKNGGI